MFPGGRDFIGVAVYDPVMPILDLSQREARVGPRRKG
jgi:hypothetical protein